MNQRFTLNRLLTELESKSSSLSNSTLNAYRKGVNSLREYVEACGEDEEVLNADSLRNWCAWMRIKGLSKPTAIYYMENVAALLPENTGRDISSSLAEECREIKRELTSIPEENFSLRAPGETERIRLFIYNGITSDREDPYGDLLRVALLTSICPSYLLSYTFKNGIELPHEATILIDRYRRPRLRYIFRLDPTEHCASKKIVNNLLRRLGSLSQSQPPLPYPEKETLNSWAALIVARILVELGATPSIASGVVRKYCDRYSLFTPAATQEIPEKEQKEWLSVLQNRLLDDPAQWHAFHLRANAAIASVRNKLEEEFGNRVEFYYPEISVARREGRRIVSKPYPLLQKMFFLRIRGSRLQAVTAALTPLAWCYRTSGHPSAPFARIPDSEMEKFQKKIGIFSPESEFYATGIMEIRPGDDVTVVGGPFTGYSATVSENSPRDDRMIRLRLPGSNGIEWQISLDSRLAQKKPDSKSLKSNN